MAKVLLINPVVREWTLPNCVPSGLLYLSAVLAQRGHEVEILDWNGLRWNESQVEEYIKEADYELIGVGGIITTYKRVKWILEVIKRHHPNTVTVVGGPLATSIPRIILEQTGADIVCIGEGELTIVELMENLNNLERVAGIWYKHNGQIRVNASRELIKDLDSVPFPDYENLETIDVYARNPIGYLNRRKWIDGKPASSMKSLNIITARGCPFNCNFCFSKYLGNKYRVRSINNVIDEMELLIEKYGCEYIHFNDELSFTPQRTHAFCDALERRALKVLWGMPFRIDLATKELLERMRECGCVHLSGGIESFSPEVLRAMNKRVNPHKVKRNLALAMDIIEDVDTSFILGYPSETRQTIQETIEVCKEINLVPNAIFFATPYPGTELYRIALERGLIKDEVEFIESLGEQGEYPRVNFTDIPTEELMREKKRWLREVADKGG